MPTSSFLFSSLSINSPRSQRMRRRLQNSMNFGHSRRLCWLSNQPFWSSRIIKIKKELLKRYIARSCCKNILMLWWGMPMNAKTILKSEEWSLKEGYNAKSSIDGARWWSNRRLVSRWLIGCRSTVRWLWFGIASIPWWRMFGEIFQIRNFLDVKRCAKGGSLCSCPIIYKFQNLRSIAASSSRPIACCLWICK